MRCFVIVALMLGFATVCAAQDGAKWTYEGKTGPLVWGKLDPSYEVFSSVPKATNNRLSTFAARI